MRSLITIALITLIAACTRTQIVAAPEPPKPVPNRARPLAEMMASSDTKCILWTGRETPYGGVDSMLCVAPNQVVYVKAPDDSAPEMKITLQTEAPADARKGEPPKPVPPKPEPKKK